MFTYLNTPLMCSTYYTQMAEAMNGSRPTWDYWVILDLSVGGWWGGGRDGGIGRNTVKEKLRAGVVWGAMTPTSKSIGTWLSMGGTTPDDLYANEIISLS